MNNIILLTRIQLKQSLGAMFDRSDKRKSGSGRKSGKVGFIVAAVVIVALVILMGAGGYFAYQLLHTVEGASAAFVGILLLASAIFTFFLGVPSVLSSFFASSDIDDLLPLPLTELSISVSKALSSLSSSYVAPALFLIGPLAGWGVAAGAGPLYWVSLVLIVICAPMIPVAYAGIISILLASVFKRLRSKDTVTTLATVVSIVVALAASLSGQLFNGGGNDTAAMLVGAQGVVGGALMAFPAYGFAGGALAGDAMSLVLYVVISLAIFAVFILFSRVMYLRIVTKLSSGGHAAKAYAGEAGAKSSSAFRTLVRADMNKVRRTSALFLTQFVYPVLIMVFCIAVAGWRTISRISEDMPQYFASNSTAGDITVAPFALSGVLVLAALMSMANRLSQSAVSREGSNWSHMKYIPVPYEIQLRAKTVIGIIGNALVALVGLGAVMGYLIVVMHVNPLFLVCGLVLAASAIWLSACVGIAADCSAPRVAWGNDSEANNKTSGGGGGTIRSLVVYIVIGLLPLLGSMFTGLDPYIVIPVVSVAAAVVAFVLGRRFISRAARDLALFEG